MIGRQGQTVTVQLNAAPTSAVSVLGPKQWQIADAGEYIVSESGVDYLSVHNTAGNSTHTVTVRQRYEDPETTEEVALILMTKSVAAGSTLVYVAGEWTVYT